MLRRRRRSGGSGAVNRPNITVPAAQAILLSSAPLVFATSISVSDAVETSLTVSLAFPGGTITLDGTTGLSFSVGDGTADAAMTFSGTITNINNALSGMSVTAGSTGDRTLSITATNTTGSNSVSVAVQFGAIPVFTVDPAISGSTDYGNTLTCSDGTVTGYPTPTLTRQWQNTGSNISGQTASTWVSAFGDVGDTITCEVTATNAYGADLAETAGVVIRDPDALTITDLTVAWDGLTAADVGYVDGEILAGDYLDFQIDTVTTFDSVDLEETSELLDAGEISGGAFEVVLPTLADDTWYIRVRVRRGSQVSAWSAYDTYTPAPTAASYVASTAGDSVVASPSSNVITYTSRDFVDGDAIITNHYAYNSRNVTGVTITGVGAMTKIHDVSNANPAEYATVWRLNGVTAGSYSVVVTWNATPGPVGFHSGTLVNGAASATDTAGREDAYTAGVITTSSSLTIPTDGVGLCVAWLGGGTTGNAAWSNGTELDETVSGGWGISSAVFSAGTVTPEVDWAQSGGGSAVAISWAPA
jgi:hypothetical protein